MGSPFTRRRASRRTIDESEEQDPKCTPFHGEGNGPHCRVRGSHRNKPDALWRAGRISDAGLAAHSPAEDTFEIAGKRGTLILADTRGVHRGKMLRAGERLIPRLEFADSLVGKPLQPCRLVEGSPLC